jgi:stage III sporulation protein AE
MKKIIKFLLCINFAIIILLFSGVSVYAQDGSAASELDIDISGLDDNVSSDVNEILQENGISADSTDGIASVSAGDVIAYMASQLKDNLKYPLKIFCMICGVILVCTVVTEMGLGTESKQLNKVYETVCVLISVAVISDPIIECINTASETLSSGSEFMVSYVPVFASITASSGLVTSAAAYSAILLTASEGAAVISSEYMMPVLSLCTALGVIESINPSLKLTNITEMLTKAVKMLLSLIMTVFIGLLSLQNIIGTSADTLGVKTAKFFAANFIPVIGGAVADAYTTVKSGLGILRGGAGVFGIAVIFLTVMPPLAKLALMKIAFSFSEMLSDMFGITGFKILMKNASAVVSVLISLVVCFALMLIISTVIMLMTGLNIS